MLVTAIQQAYVTHEKRIQDALQLERPPLGAAERKLLEPFQAWCGSRGVRPLPATPATVAAYIQSLPEGQISAALDAIQAAHDYIGVSSPVGSHSVRTVLAHRLTIFSAPRSWRRDEQLLWDQLPPEIKRTITRREADRDTALRNKQNELAGNARGVAVELRRYIKQMKGLSKNVYQTQK
jgi:hypothetical protein